jgi:hypothetical protein
MVLPQWLKSRTQPVAIDDVVLALVRASSCRSRPARASISPGPHALRKADPRGNRARHGLEHPRMVEVPLLSPRLSSLWVRFVTRAKWSVAREVVIGLTQDLLARDDRFWRLIDHPNRMTFAEAARAALAAERYQRPAGGTWGAIERSGASGTARPERRPERERSCEVRRTWLALASMVVWLVAAASARLLGIWPDHRRGRGRAGGRRPGARRRGDAQDPSAEHSAGCRRCDRRRVDGRRDVPPSSGSCASLAGRRDRHRPSVRFVSRAAAGHGVARALARDHRRGAGLARRRANGARAAPRMLARRRPGGARLYARARAARVPLLVAAALLCGTVWSTLRAVSGSLVPSLLAHLVWDVLVFLWLPLDPR